MPKQNNIKKYIDNAHVYLDIKADNKKDLLDEILNNVNASGMKLDIDKIIENIYKKESLGTSGLGYGVAFPHTYTEDVDDEKIIFATSKKGIIYNSLDDKPVHLIIMFLTPQSQSSQYLSHLSMLAKITHLAMHVVLLNEAKTEKEFKKTLECLVDNFLEQ